MALAAWLKHSSPCLASASTSYLPQPLYEPEICISILKELWVKWIIWNTFPRPAKWTIFNWIISWSKIHTSVLAEAWEPEERFPKQVPGYKQRSDLSSLNPKVQQLHKAGHHGRNRWASRQTPGFHSCTYSVCTVPSYPLWEPVYSLDTHQQTPLTDPKKTRIRNPKCHQISKEILFFLPQAKRQEWCPGKRMWAGWLPLRVQGHGTGTARRGQAGEGVMEGLISLYGHMGTTEAQSAPMHKASTVKRFCVQKPQRLGMLEPI